MLPIGLCVPCWHTEGAWACQQAQMCACWHAQAPYVCQQGTQMCACCMPKLRVYANRAHTGRCACWHA